MAPIKRGLNWLIVGGDGQLGRSLNEELSRNGEAFNSLNRSQLDITNEVEIRNALDEFHPSVVVNAAAWTNVDAAENSEGDARLVNSLGPSLLAQACLTSESRLVHLSTDYVFSGQSQGAWSEGSDVNPASSYGRTKAEGEKLVQEHFPSGSFIVRTAWLYGKHGRNFAKTMVNLALRNAENIEVVNDQVGQPTCSTDLAKQICRLMYSEAPPGIYHGTNSGEATWFDFAREIFSLVGTDPNRVLPVDSQRLSHAAVRPVYSVLGHQRWSDFGLEPMRDWHEALESAMPGILTAVNLGGN